jgi:outer membrane immunogenic protein
VAAEGAIEVGDIPKAHSVPPRTGNPSVANLDSASARIGGYLGYNWQFAPHWLAGVEGDLAWGDGSGSVSPIPGTVFDSTSCGIADCSVDSATAKLGWDASLRGRLGVLVMPSWLLYGTGGVAWQHLEVEASCNVAGPWCIANRSESTSSARVGWTVGAGIETMLDDNWLARVEYRYADFGTIDHVFFADAHSDSVNMSAPLTTQSVSFGIAYKFSGQ